jgi:hypothetical protein
MKEAAHLVRLAGLFLLGLFAFLLLRQTVMPAGFGKYGHYRAGAIEEVRAHAMTYAGRNACAACHDDALQKLRTSGHHGVGCETCHGPLLKHAADPASLKPQLPEVTRLCGRCHEASAAKPKSFPQVAIQEHAGGSGCKDCHEPHRPK